MEQNGQGRGMQQQQEQLLEEWAWVQHCRMMSLLKRQRHLQQPQHQCPRAEKVVAITDPGRRMSEWDPPV